jgi:hypothetical protein
MFWKKKEASATGSTATVSGVVPSAPKVEKLPGPRKIPGVVEKHLVNEYKMDAGLVQLLKAVVRKRPQAEGAFDCRIFDGSEAEAGEVGIADYNSLNEHPELILYEGWFNEDAKQVEMAERKKISFDVPLFTEAEIRQRIEGLSEPGKTVFFYQNAGPARGGPLGMGAAVVELSPSYPKKGKKYVIYTTNVVGMEPVGNKNKLFDSDKSKDIAKWVKEAHNKRLY